LSKFYSIHKMLRHFTIIKGHCPFTPCMFSKGQIRSKTSAVFKELDGKFDLASTRHQEAVAKYEVAHALYSKFMEQVQAGGGPKGVHRHTKINKKLLVRDRVKLLLDEDSDAFTIGSLAGLGMDYGDVPSAGGLNVIGKVSGHYCVVMGSDATIKGGTVYPIGLKKQLRMQEISYQNRLPCINLTDSGGAFLPLQSEIFPDRHGGGRVFRNQAVMQADGPPQITVVCGSCTAGGAYVPTMSQEAIIVNGIGYIYLAGPPLVKAATGEEISDEDLGGADLHSRVSGCVDHFAETEVEAYELCRSVIETLNLEEVIFREDYEAPLYLETELNNFVGLHNISRNDIYKILSRILDSSRFQEFKAKFGSNLITGFGYIGGKLVGVVANGGTITSPDALKGTHFVWMCEYRNIPLVFLQYSTPADDSTRVNPVQAGLVIKDKAKMMAAVACTKVPRISINIGGCFGDDNYTMCGQTFSPNFLLSWPTALTSLDTPLGDQVEKDSDLSKVESAWDLPPSSAFSCAFNMYNDAIILPQETRKALIQCLRIAQHSQIRRYFVDNHVSPIFRM